MSSNETGSCKMEFYFTSDSIKKLLDQNPKAKGIIIRHEIIVEGGISVSKISAIADNDTIADPTTQTDTREATIMSETSVDSSFSGWPNPPGPPTN